MISRRRDACATRTAGPRVVAAAATLAAASVAAGLLAGCSSGGSPAGAQAPTSPAPAATGGKHGPMFPECGGVSDQVIAQQTQLAGLSNTAKTSVGCQWLAGGGILGPHISFNWYRGSPIGRERKTEELTRTSVQDVDIDGHQGFIALNQDPVLGPSLCEIGIQFDEDFIEWSISFAQKPFPDACGVAKELATQSIANAK